MRADYVCPRPAPVSINPNGSLFLTALCLFLWPPIVLGFRLIGGSCSVETAGVLTLSVFIGEKLFQRLRLWFDQCCAKMF